MKTYPLLINAIPMDDYKLLLFFSNNEKKTYDFKINLNHPYYKSLTDESFFCNVKVENGELEWATGQDFCPYTLYEKSVPYNERAGSCAVS